MSIASEAMPYTRDERTVGQKVPRFISRKYRAFVADHACAHCRIEGYSQAAHSNRLADGKGRGYKTSDVYIMPLCGPRPGIMGCHTQHDQGGGIEGFDDQAAIEEMRAIGRAAGFPV